MGLVLDISCQAVNYRRIRIIERPETSIQYLLQTIDELVTFISVCI
jgi:hypothetical protein